MIYDYLVDYEDLGSIYARQKDIYFQQLLQLQLELFTIKLHLWDF